MKKNIGFIRFNHLWEDKKIVSNIFWESIVLKNEEFDNYINNNIDKDSWVYKDLIDKNFYYYDVDTYIKNWVEKYKERFWINYIWPTLHIIVLTKWCNHQCKYCHSSALVSYDDENINMNYQTAKKVVDIILSSPSDSLTIEFQWWEPLLNFELIDYVVEYTEKQNKFKKKKISYALVSNLSLIDEKMLEKIFSFPNFSISTSLDWDKSIHDFNRVLIWKKINSSFDVLSEKISLIRDFEKIKWKKILYWAMWVITKKSLWNYKKIVDTYLSLWFDNIFLKKIDSLWFASKTKNTLWYSSEELIDFYTNYYNYLAELYNKWIKVYDWFLRIILWKIINPKKTNFMDLRSPCWAGIWQIAYDYTWNIYTCDEWRMVDDEIFKIWYINSSLEDLIQNDTIWIMMDASTTESLVCDICAYAPFCWVCPVESYKLRWNIYTNVNHSEHCNFFKFLFDFCFKILSDDTDFRYNFLINHSKICID